jgi:hypothetical protein
MYTLCQFQGKKQAQNNFFGGFQGYIASHIDPAVILHGTAYFCQFVVFLGLFGSIGL